METRVLICGVKLSTPLATSKGSRLGFQGSVARRTVLALRGSLRRMDVGSDIVNLVGRCKVTRGLANRKRSDRLSLRGRRSDLIGVVASH
jgi:hypothetical protein